MCKPTLQKEWPTYVLYLGKGKQTVSFLSEDGDLTETQTERQMYKVLRESLTGKETVRQMERVRQANSQGLTDRVKDS